jgi:hypothetical protein
MEIVNFKDKDYVNNLPDNLHICTCFDKNKDSCQIYIKHTIVYIKKDNDTYMFNISDIGHYLLKNKTKIDRLNKINNILNF